MPEGIITEVTGDGFATVDFVDKSLRGKGVAQLVELAGVAAVKVDTRSGPRKLYIVPEDAARAAGFIDQASEVPVLPAVDKSSGTDAAGMEQPNAPTVRNIHAQALRSGTYSQAFNEGNGTYSAATPNDLVESVDAELPAALTPIYPDGKPHKTWRRAELDAYAEALYGLDTTTLSDKDAVLDAIADAAP